MHHPVLLTEVIRELHLKPGSLVIDCTIGSGGHAEAILREIGQIGRLLGLDKDPTTIARLEKRMPSDRCTLVHGSFDELESIAGDQGFEAVDAILFDLGMSSEQLDDPSRGLSFQKAGPLDMRLDPTAELTAADLINRSSQKQLADIFYQFGELYDARRFANTVVQWRVKKAILTTLDLVKVLGLKNPGVKAKLFQALRIAVNDELGQLERAIPQAVALLKPGGRLAIITFHSLEDRIVKNSFKKNHRLYIITKKPICPTVAEAASNPRSRSAKLRVAEKTGE